MKPQYHIYIDEAGDDGLTRFKQPGASGGASHWLAIGACIVSRENDQNMVAWRDEVRNRINQVQARSDDRTIHFKSMKHHGQRIAACKVLENKPIGIVAALYLKTTVSALPKERFDAFKKKNQLYSHVTRYVIERASEVCKRRSQNRGITNCKARIIFSRRGGMNYEEFREYMTLVRDGREVIKSSGSIDWDVVDPERIDANDHKNVAGLQIADVVTSAIHHAVEADMYGNFETSYAHRLRDRFLRGQNGRILGCGVVPMPNLPEMGQLHPEQLAFFQSLDQK